MTIKEITVEAVKGAPPATVASMTVFGLPLSDAVLVLTGVYTAFMLYFLLRDKWWRQRGKH